MNTIKTLDGQWEYSGEVIKNPLTITKNKLGIQFTWTRRMKFGGMDYFFVFVERTNKSDAYYITTCPRASGKFDAYVISAVLTHQAILNVSKVNL